MVHSSLRRGTDAKLDQITILGSFSVSSNVSCKYTANAPPCCGILAGWGSRSGASGWADGEATGDVSGLAANHIEGLPVATPERMPPSIAVCAGFSNYTDRVVPVHWPCLAEDHRSDCLI